MKEESSFSGEREARVIFPEKLDDFICLQGTLREMPDNFEARVVFGGLFFRLIFMQNLQFSQLNSTCQFDVWLI